MNKILTIVVAAGSGRRMGGEVPKQFLLLGNEPIVIRTLRRMTEAVGSYRKACSQNVHKAVDGILDVDNFVHKVALVLPEDCLDLWDKLCREYDFRVPHEVVAGGNTRFQSVKNGLAAMPDADLVLVHDGVRPFPDNALVGEVILAAEAQGAAIPVTPVVDSLRQLTPEGKNVAADRAAFRAVQTPQGFRGDLLRRAYGVEYDERFTDDASVVEIVTGTPVILTPGSSSNIKITTPADLAIAEVLLKM